MNSAIPFPLETERLVIRPLRLGDAEDLHELYSDGEAMRFLADEVPRTVEESRAWVQSKIDLHERDGGFSLWAIVERRSGRVVGDCGLQWEELEDGRRELELACRLVPSRWGEGFAFEASEACLDAAVRHAGCQRVIARTGVNNERALRLLERLGMRWESETKWEGRRMAFYAWNADLAKPIETST